MSIETIKDNRWVGQYTIANSAGTIDIEKNRYQTLNQAKRAAKLESMAGFLGECWPVRIIKESNNA